MAQTSASWLSLAPSPLTLTESSVEAMAQTPASWPSLVDQLRREGIELRNRGDTTNAIERLQEALDSEPNNAAVLAELAKTYDLDRKGTIHRVFLDRVHGHGPFGQSQRGGFVAQGHIGKRQRSDEQIIVRLFFEKRFQFAARLSPSFLCSGMVACDFLRPA